MTGFTGIDSSYEPPENPDLVLKASECTVQECVDELVKFLQERVFLKYMYYNTIVLSFIQCHVLPN